ncbi:hypothetical protein Ari01nite_44880 [Paractinoplanes rishiriensis]|uniref:DNA alkylation repair protein n=1 Tax=Paractinoplanes rishiriensis TaxID=1050105 RepID=A0A919K1P8_9ACTN|nr:hypothetical protein Ari01nite_44880 [Actinoplanes rishiriensis]
MTDLPALLLARLDSGFSTTRDPVRAEAMAAYMRGQFPFFGVPSPALRSLARTAMAGLPAPTAPELAQIADACWSRPQREFHYFACDYLRKHQRVASAGFLENARTLITTKSWWDTVDPLATRFVGDLVRRHPSLLPEIDAWSRHDNMWLVRTAILHQLHYADQTDTDRLFAYCTHQAKHQDFFVRKAIGWALRQYARTDPSAVREFVAGTTLSPLSVREATKHL